mmetsp:Transcript_7116/g.10844  ORF Transcript_7116/g.10844 Transcript_7116/m.10844 type:complete len:460 (+) Transcript_7116:1449-2828(+)
METSRYYPPVKEIPYNRNGNKEILSMYTIFREKKVWGEDANEFKLRPLAAYHKNLCAFNEWAPRRACPGKSLAWFIVRTFLLEISNRDYTLPESVEMKGDSQPKGEFTIKRTEMKTEVKKEQKDIQVTADVKEAKTAVKKKPKALPFAVMRNCHECIRSALKELTATSKSNDTPAVFRSQFKNLQRCIKTHALLESKGFFPLLDEFSGGKLKEIFDHEHDEDHELQHKVTEKLEVDDFKGAVAAFEIWKEAHLKHLKAEEKNAMPIVPKMAKAKCKGDSVKMGGLFNEHILSKAMDDIEWFTAYNCRILSKYGSTKHDGFTAMRVWIVGLQYSCTPEEWKKILPNVKTSVLPEHYEKLCKEFEIEGEGKVIKQNIEEKDATKIPKGEKAPMEVTKKEKAAVEAKKEGQAAQDEKKGETKIASEVKPEEKEVTSEVKPEEKAIAADEEKVEKEENATSEE